MDISIIEDASPYYVRFQHPGISDIIDCCLRSLLDLEDIFASRANPEHAGFAHVRLDRAQGRRILGMTPVARRLPLREDRVSLFITQPGYYYRAHKDGLATRISINYPIMVQDRQCQTRWYADQDLAHYAINNLSQQISRECQDFDPAAHEPLCEMTAGLGEGILFNTDIFHDFDNSLSDHYRVVLTLRLDSPLRESLYFDHARDLIFS